MKLWRDIRTESEVLFSVLKFREILCAMQPDQTDDRLQFYHCKRNAIAFQSGNYCPIGFYFNVIINS